jgi:hypothetical protein
MFAIAWEIVCVLFYVLLILIGISVALAVVGFPFYVTSWFIEAKKEKRERRRLEENHAAYLRGTPIPLPDDLHGDYEKRMDAHKEQLRKDATTKTPLKSKATTKSRDWHREYTDAEDRIARGEKPENIPSILGVYR